MTLEEAYERYLAAAREIGNPGDSRREAMLAQRGHVELLIEMLGLPADAWQMACYCCEEAMIETGKLEEENITPEERFERAQGIFGGMYFAVLATGAIWAREAAKA